MPKIHNRLTKKERLITCGFLSLSSFLFHPDSLSQDFITCNKERHLARGKVEHIRENWPLRHSDAVTTYIRKLGSRLVNHSTRGHKIRWYFNVVKDRSPNAFAVGNGYIYITEGAINLCNSEAELAAILAYEIGHQLAGHFCPQQRNGPGQELRDWFNDYDSPQYTRERKIGSFSQIINLENEAEADRLAVELLIAAGHDPHAMLAVTRRLPTVVSYFAKWRNQQRISTLTILLNTIPRKETQASRQLGGIKRLLQ